MGSKRAVIKFIIPHYLKKAIVRSWGSGEPLIFLVAAKWKFYRG